jgi:hypothetical protein
MLYSGASTFMAKCRWSTSGGNSTLNPSRLLSQVDWCGSPAAFMLTAPLVVI